MIRLLPILLMCLGLAMRLQAGTLAVAAASDLENCLPEIDAAFEKAHPGLEVKPSFGSSGNFFAEIRNGAPFDVFLSADIGFPRQLAKLGACEEPATYARGRLVLWTMDAALDVSRGLDALRNPSVTHVAIANPDHAPYGRAAKAALEAAHLWEPLLPKLATGESVAQAAQFVETGNASAGFVALSLINNRPPGKAGRFYELPLDQYPPLWQAAAVIKPARDGAREYVEFLKGDVARAILARHGFLLPG